MNTIERALSKQKKNQEALETVDDASNNSPGNPLDSPNALGERVLPGQLEAPSRNY